MSRLRSISQKALKWIWIGGAEAVAAVLATRFYYAEEMLAALLLFAVLFTLVAGTVLLSFVLYSAGKATLGFGESWGKAMLQHARRGRGLLEYRTESEGSSRGRSCELNI
jgi:hypothetical protein